jgi:hypothetical protein
MPRIVSLPLSKVTLVAVVISMVVLGTNTSPLSAATTPHAKPSGGPRIIIDTDLSLWWDDATAVGMANVLQQSGRLRILGIASDIPNPLAVAAISAIDTAYGHPKIPLGAVTGSAADTAPHGYSDTLVRKFPHAIASSAQVAGAVSLFRHLLASQRNHSVTIVAIGAYTNLAGLLRSKSGQGSGLSGRALVANKVKRLVLEDGLFPAGAPPLTNQKLDLAAAREVVAGSRWPTPIAWVDGFVGIRTRVGGTLCATVPPSNPMRVVYEAEFGCGPPGDGDWDGPTLLYAVGGTQGFFSASGRGGAAVIGGTGGLVWRHDPARPHDVYVHVTNQQALNQRIDSLIVSP